MNKFIQLAHNSFLIGSDEDARALEHAQQAKLLVLSDTHGDTKLAESIVTHFGAQCDALVFCGDGAGDIASLFFARQNVRDAIPPVVALARGNGDGEYYSNMTQTDESGKRSFFKITVPRQILFCAAGRTILAVHGHQHYVEYGPESLKQAAQRMNADIVFFGHTHYPFKSDWGALLAVNPGSCSRPRRNMPHTFAVVSIEREIDVRFYEILRTGKDAQFSEFTVP